MARKIKIDLEQTLRVPDGGVLQSIAVTVEMTPGHAGCLIYGTLADGSLGCVEVRGLKTDVDLPFVYPQIYIRYLRGPDTFSLRTRGWRQAPFNFVPPKRVELISKA